MTLKILKNQINSLVLTLNELANPENPSNWLFVFTSEQSLQEVGKLYLTDLSEFPERYNKFELQEPETVEFVLAGDYKYEVYQMPDGDSLVITEGVLVEVGKLRVVEDETTVVYEAEVKNKTYER
jgi:hypothetical protein